MTGDAKAMLVRLAIVFVPNFAAFALHAGYEMLRAEKRGKFNVERTFFYQDLNPETVKKYMRERLIRENFRILKEADPLVLEAMRQAPRPKNSMMDAYPYPKLQLKMRVEFLPHSHGTQVRMIGSNISYLVRETGEINYMEAFLDFLMGKSSFRDVPPDRNSNATSSVYIAAVTIAIPWLVFFFGFDSLEFATVVGINAVPIILAIVQAIHGIVQMGTKPTQSYGYKYAIAGIVLALVAAISTVAAIFVYDL